MTRLQSAAARWREGMFGPMGTMPGEKRPNGAWRQYQNEPAPPETVDEMLNGDGSANLGLVLLPGQECIDVEGRAVADETWQSILDAAERAGVDEVLARVLAGYHERTPSGGLHLLWWCNEAEGNQKLAARPRADGGEDVLIETRGPGGFVVVAPSPGWDWQAGAPHTVAEITPEERDDLLALFRVFDERISAPAPVDNAPAGDGTRPGDDYNMHASWADVLEPHGWVQVATGPRGEMMWRRPGKDRGWSATTGATVNDTLHVHSTSTPFTTSPTSYSKFSAYALLNHHGDHAAAAAELAQRGYGDQSTPHANELAGAVGDLTDPQAQDEALTREMMRLRLQREARRRVDAEERPPAKAPEVLSLRERLKRPQPPVTYRINGWQPTGCRVMLAAQFKAGKTTLVGNVARCLLDGDQWLGQHYVEPLAGTLVVLDLEMSGHQLDSWLADQHINNDDRLIPISLRGNAGSLDILDPQVRSQWAGKLRELGCEYLVLDCLRPILDALGLDEHRDAGRFLVAFDALMGEAGISDALIVHHMGHSGERSRGDSRIRDWPDVEWRLVREDAEDPASRRYVSAYGRDVEISESLLEHDPITRHLTVTGGSRKEAGGRMALGDVVAALGDEEMSQNAVEAALAESEHTRTAVREALKIGVRDQYLSMRTGARNAKLYRHLASSPHLAASSPARRAEHLAARRRPLGRRGAQSGGTDEGGDGARPPPRHGEVICTTCGQPLAAAAVAGGFTTHPSCEGAP